MSSSNGSRRDGKRKVHVTDACQKTSWGYPDIPVIGRICDVRACEELISGVLGWPGPSKHSEESARFHFPRGWKANKGWWQRVTTNNVCNDRQLYLGWGHEVIYFVLHVRLNTESLFNETFPCRAVSNWKWRKSVHVSMSFHKHPNTMSSSRYSSTKICKSKMKKLTQFNHIHFYRINRSFSQWTDEKQFNTMKTNVKHIFRSLSYSFVDIHVWFCRVMLLLKG